VGVEVAVSVHTVLAANGRVPLAANKALSPGRQSPPTLTEDEVAELLAAMHTIHDLLERGRPDDDKGLSPSDLRAAAI
jgi:hypothetical protein